MIKHNVKKLIKINNNNNLNLEEVLNTNHISI
jgi:hypothetical protein